MRSEKVAAALLAASSDIAAILAVDGAGTINAVAANDTTHVPYVVYAFDGAVREPTVSFAEKTIVTSQIAVMGVTRDYPTLKTLMEAIRVALAYQHGTIAGVVVGQITISAEEPDAFQPDLRLFGQTMRFAIVHEE